MYNKVLKMRYIRAIVSDGMVYVKANTIQCDILDLFFQMLLDHRSRSEVSRMVSARTNSATPLVMAAKNGHLTCVEYLVERCSADLEQVGSG